MGQHPAEKQSQRSDLLQPVSQGSPVRKSTLVTAIRRIRLPKSKSFDGGAQFKLTSLLQKQRARGAASSFQDWSCPIVLPL